MATTIPDIKITSEWQSLNSLSGIAVGTSFLVNNKGNVGILMYENTTIPTDNTSNNGILLTPPFWSASCKYVETGSGEIWVKCTTPASSTGLITVQLKNIT